MLVSYDARRDLYLAPTPDEAITFATDHWVNSAKRAIQQRGRFTVALSGGSTPKIIYERLAKRTDLDWSKVYLFWSDERAVPLDHPESNYKMAHDTGLLSLPPPSQIFPFQNAATYNDLIHRLLSPHLFDLVMLGLGEDGHTASLFPSSPALNSTSLTAANPVPSKTPRLTLTFPCINSCHSTFYVLGTSKHLIVPKVLTAAIDSPYPASRIGTPEHKALFILDPASSASLTIQ